MMAAGEPMSLSTETVFHEKIQRSSVHKTMRCNHNAFVLKLKTNAEFFFLCLIYRDIKREIKTMLTVYPV